MLFEILYGDGCLKIIAKLYKSMFFSSYNTWFLCVFIYYISLSPQV